MTLKQKFKSAIKRGTGEAHILLMENPDVDFSDEIIQASLKNLAYDRQCESRDEYVFGLIERSAQKKKIKQTIFQVLAMGEPPDDWGFYHLCNLARRFANHGDEEARKAIYKRY
jgi:hypothetical protein